MRTLAALIVVFFAFPVLAQPKIVGGEHHLCLSDDEGVKCWVDPFHSAVTRSGLTLLSAVLRGWDRNGATWVPGALTKVGEALAAADPNTEITSVVAAFPDRSQLAREPQGKWLEWLTDYWKR